MMIVIVASSGCVCLCLCIWMICVIVGYMSEFNVLCSIGGFLVRVGSC